MKRHTVKRHTAKRHTATIAIAACSACLIATAFVRGSRSGTSRVSAPVIDSLPSPAGTGSAEPNLTVGPDGRVYLSWLEQANPGYAFKFAVHDGTKWSTPQIIAQRTNFFVNWADFPSMIVLDGGRLAAHWLQKTGTSTYAYAVQLSQSGDGGKTWSTPITAHRDTSLTEHGFVALWNERGTLGAAWLDGRKTGKGEHDHSGAMMLVSTTLSANGTLGPEVQLDERTCDCCQNSAAMTSNGPIVAYRNRTSDEVRDVYVTRRVGGKWIAGTAVHNDNWKIAACPVNGPAIAANGNRVAIAWFAAPDDSGRVNVALSNDAGATFAKPVRVDGGKPAGRVDILTLADGGALVTWIERTGGDTAAVLARRISRDGKAGTPVTIASSSASRNSGFPHAVQTGNSIVFAWTVASRPTTVRVARAPLSDFR